MGRARVVRVARVVAAGVLGVALAATGASASATAGPVVPSTTLRVASSAAPTSSTAVASDVVGPVSPGSTTVLTVPAGATAEWTFTAARGQYIRMSVGPITGQSYYCGLEVAVVGPDGSTLFDSSCVVDGSQLDRATAILSGEHRVRLVNPGTTDMQVPVTLTVARDRQLSLAPGTATTVALSQPGQRAVQTVSAVKGQVPTLTLTGSTFSSYDLQMVLRDGAGREMPRLYQGSAVAWAALPATGRYTLTITSPSGTTGRFTETLGLSVPPVYALTKGVPVSVAPVDDGTTVRLTFHGTVGQSAVLRFDRPVYDYTYVWLVSPEGFGIASDFLYGTGGGIDFGTPLSSTGTYSILLTGGLSNGATVQVATGTASSGGPLTLGTPTPVAVTRPGASRSLTFDGVAGEHPVLSTSAASWDTGTAQAVVRRPDGSVFDVFDVSRDAPFDELPPLDTDGRWTITVDPDLTATGSVTLTLDLVQDQVVDVVPGTPVHVAVDRPGQNVLLRFPVRDGERTTLTTTGSSWTGGDGGPVGIGTRLLVPGGAQSSEFVYATSSGSSFSATQDPLLGAGTWTLLVDPSGSSVGSADLVLATVVDASVAMPKGAVGTLTVAQPGQVVTGTVTVPYGARLTARLVSSSWSGSDGPATLPALQVRQRGNVIGALSFATDPAFARTDPSPVASTTWSVIVDPSGDVTGSVALVLDTVRDVVVPADLGRTTTAAVTKPGQSVRFTFPVGSGQQLRWSATTGFTGQASAGYNGDAYPTYLADVGPVATSGTLVAPITGSGAFVVTPYGAQTGKVSVRLG